VSDDPLTSVRALTFTMIFEYECIWCPFLSHFDAEFVESLILCRWFDRIKMKGISIIYWVWIAILNRSMITTFRFLHFVPLCLFCFFWWNRTRSTTSFHQWMMSALIPIDIVILHSIKFVFRGCGYFHHESHLTVNVNLIESPFQYTFISKCAYSLPILQISLWKF